MPGVTVTISSPSMQGARTAVTNEEGAYRFPAIPPGDYEFTYELAGFRPSCAKGSASASASPPRSTSS